MILNKDNFNIRCDFNSVSILERLYAVPNNGSIHIGPIVFVGGTIDTSVIHPLQHDSAIT